MQCKFCDSLNVTPASPNRSGSERWRCKDCKKFWTPKPKKGGRKSIGDRPMTGYERLKKHLNKPDD